jgi:hypothetical protein
MVSKRNNFWAATAGRGNNGPSALTWGAQDDYEGRSGNAKRSGEFITEALGVFVLLAFLDA